MKNKKIVYVENKDDLVEILNNENNEVEKSPQNKRIQPIWKQSYTADVEMLC